MPCAPRCAGRGVHDKLTMLVKEAAASVELGDCSLLVVLEALQVGQLNSPTQGSQGLVSHHEAVMYALLVLQLPFCCYAAQQCRYVAAGGRFPALDHHTSLLFGGCQVAVEAVMAEHPEATTSGATRAGGAGATRQNSSQLLRCVVWFHHIKSITKRKQLVAWARELDVAGYSKPGFPGGWVLFGTKSSQSCASFRIQSALHSRGSQPSICVCGCGDVTKCCGALKP